MDATELLELLKTHPNTKPAYVKAADSKSYPAESLHEKIVSKAPLDILKLQNPSASVTRSAIRDAINKEDLKANYFLHAFDKSKCYNTDYLLEAIKTYLDLHRADDALEVIRHRSLWRPDTLISILIPFTKDLVKNSDILLHAKDCPEWLKEDYMNHDINYITHPGIEAINKKYYERAIKSGIPRIMAMASKKYKNARAIIDKKPQKLLENNLWNHIFLDEDLVDYLKSPKFKEALDKTNLPPEQKDQIRGEIAQRFSERFGWRTY